MGEGRTLAAHPKFTTCDSHNGGTGDKRVARQQLRHEDQRMPRHANRVRRHRR